MSTSITVRRFLDKQDVRYAITPYSGATEEVLCNGTDNVSPQQIAKAIILKDLRGMLMAVIPGPNTLNIDALNRQLHRNLQLAGSEDYQGIFADCMAGIVPPLGEAYGFETIIDDRLLDQDLIYFVSGNDRELLRISGYDFQLLHSNAWYGNTFSNIVQEDAATKSGEPADQPALTKPLNMKQQIEKVTNLPPMPSMAHKILQLNTNPYAHAADLAKIIEKDPSLSAQIIRYAQSPFYGYDGNVASVRQAISRVLGYDLVMNIALGIAVTRPFKNTPHGPLGLHAFWRHAAYSASVAQTLCNSLPRNQRPRPGTAYLCGLLHNFGFLLLGYLFPKEFSILNNAVSEDPDSPVVDIERKLLGVTHMEIGKWIMDAWNMPQEVATCLVEHHNPDYKGPHAMYAQLIYITDVLLKRQEIGDAATEELPEPMLASLGVTEAQVLQALEKTIEDREELDSMARQLAA